MKMQLNQEQLDRIQAHHDAAQARINENFTNAWCGLMDMFGQPDQTVYPTHEEYKKEIDDYLKMANAKEKEGGE